jgi:5-methylcytosine-specific restriction enzyme subunit McrC
MATSPYRIALTENRPRAVLPDAAAELGQTRQEVTALLGESSRRLRKLLGLENEPILIDGDHVKVVEIAGLVRVETGLELEVAPKFLGHATPGWREDFFRIASLAQRGQILPHEDIRAGRGQSNDLASLVGRVMVEMFKQEQRRPIRLYRHRRWEDFDLDGDLDEESVFLPTESGFAQEKIVLERRNDYNAMLAEAARLLVPEVEDQDVRRQLQRMYAQLSPQTRPLAVASSQRRLPSRHRRWQQLFEIARRVVEGFGMDFTEKEAPAPGFVLRTWPVWEDLLFSAMRVGLRGSKVEAQRGHSFGKRDGKAFSVYPDGTVSEGENILWDAKYKADWERSRRRVSASDVYEANAFLEAAEFEQIALIYPRLAREGEDVLGCGEVDLFETIEVKAGTIYGLSVEARGISTRGGFQTFSTNLAGGVTSTLGLAVAASA